MEVILFVLGVVVFACSIWFFIEAVEDGNLGLFLLTALCVVVGLFLIYAGFDIDSEYWECCGDEIRSEYCSECGRAKPIECKEWKCCNHKHDWDVKFCPDCGKAKPTTDTTNNVIVKDNENVNVNVDEDGAVIIEDGWTCCNKDIKSQFCPDCGKSKNNNTTLNPEISSDNNGADAPVP